MPRRTRRSRRRDRSPRFLILGLLLIVAAATLGLRELGAGLSLLERLAALGAWSKAKRVFTESPLVVALLAAGGTLVFAWLAARLRRR